MNDHFTFTTESYTHYWGPQVPRLTVKMFDESGRWIAYARLLGEGNFEKPDSVVLCDFEVDPAYRGRHLSTELFRHARETYGDIYTTGNFSETGLAVFPKLGIKLLDGHEIHKPYREAYDFVDWERQEFK